MLSFDRQLIVRVFFSMEIFLIFICFSERF